VATILRPLLDVAAATAGLVLAVIAYATIAPMPGPTSPGMSAGTAVLASDGTILWRDTSNGLHLPVGLDAVSPALIDATIAAEDERFRIHPGVDPLAVVRAAVRLPFERSGASTITQQVARSSVVPPDGVLPLRKAREALAAIQLDARMSKDDILERYLNTMYYGRGAYGVEAAARLYFGIGASDLDIAQASYLAGLPQNPSLGEGSGEAALSRQRYVLDRMVVTGAINSETRDTAIAERPRVIDVPESPVARHFVQFARDELAAVAPGLEGRDGLLIETTLDSDIQAAAETQALLQLDRLERNDAHNAAVVVLDPRDGRVLAMAGNVTRAPEGADFNMATTPRQPGSALKPLLYALALERGYTAASPLLDVPSTFQTREAGYAPQNYDLTFRGIVTLRTALASSLNVPAVGMLDELGVASFLATLRSAGIGTLTDVERYDLALALGSGEVTLLDLATAFGAIAHGGQVVEAFAITRVRDANGQVLYERQASAGRSVMTAEAAFILSDILADPAARVPGFGRGSILDLAFPAAVKTGTTTDFRDNWTVGFTPRQVVGVWVGNVDNAPMRQVSGVTGAAPIWAELMGMVRGVQGAASFAPPPGVERREVCSPTGLKPGPACPSITMEWFATGTSPREVEQYYVRDDTGRVLVDPPAEARPWMLDGGYPLADLPGTEPGDNHVAILQPAPGAVLYLAPELARQEFALRIGCPSGARSVTVFFDGAEVARGDSCLQPLVVPLTPGKHEIRTEVLLSSDQIGEAYSSFEVRRP